MTGPLVEALGRCQIGGLCLHFVSRPGPMYPLQLNPNLLILFNFFSLTGPFFWGGAKQESR